MSAAKVNLVPSPKAQQWTKDFEEQVSREVIRKL